MNGEIFRTVSGFRQHVAAVDPFIRYDPYSKNRASQNALWQYNKNKEKSLILTLLIMKIEMFED